MSGTAGTDRRGLVAVARVAKAHGIRGELCMDIHADSPLLFAPGSTLFLVLPAALPKGPSKGGPSGAAKPVKAIGAVRPGAGRPRPYVVLTARDHNGRLILTLEGVVDRNAAEALRGAEVLISEADLPPPDEGEEYLHRLLGSSVFLADETLVGVFEAILDTPGQLTWVIRAPQSQGGKEILFPAVPEFLLGLDADAQVIHIDPPPGLLELYLDGPAAAKAPEFSGGPDVSAVFDDADDSDASGK
ncbi:MAG: ribosome maturation factor RimM [Humidesulfovibrio sp.]|uniref:ribosome maturation factor RimM n=1 Tax=Humidesulfovibrio sp. TaxID=2910988 RepID=UPI0027347B65|nr:ribosome maturation factor RimM [Humidesulfovibrio sp.]MDP2847683.1 ribosome maturation factor RimM [Humidesulfovibrio sp.]